MKLLLLHFSGTGNTDFVARYLAGKLARAPIEVDVLSIEQQPPGDVGSFDLLAFGFPVYACDSPRFVQDYVSELPPGEGRGAFAFCTKGAYAGGAVERNLLRLAARGYVPLLGASVTMPGTDGLALISKESRMARMALDKDYEHLQDADQLARRMETVLDGLNEGARLEDYRQRLPRRGAPAVVDRLWALLYDSVGRFAQSRLRVDDRCTGCDLCARICPVGIIAMHDGRPHFEGSCPLCMRCIHACPHEAIQIGGLTVNKFRWRGPKGDFRPLRLRPEHSRGGWRKVAASTPEDLEPV
jgi:ferredoxin